MTTLNKEACSCRKRIIQPPILPWESGTNRFASQAGNPAFGAFRNQVIDLPAPKLDPTLPDKAETPPIIGHHRPQISTTTINDEKTVLRPNYSPPTPKNPEVFSYRRSPVLKAPEPSSLRDFTETEKRECQVYFAQMNQLAKQAALPRFVSPSQSIAEKHEKDVKLNKLKGHRSTWKGDYMEMDTEARQRYLAWIGGQVTTIKPTGPQTYYQKLMFEREFSPELLTSKLNALK